MTDIVKATATSARTTTGSQYTCVADFGGYETTIFVAQSVSVAIGDGLLVARLNNKEWYAFDKYGIAAVPAPAEPIVKPPAPKPTITTGKAVFAPIQTVSYQGAKWRTDNDYVYQGEYYGNGNHVGCWFYGSKPRALDGSTVTDVKFRLKRRSAGGSASAQGLTLWLLSQNKKPSGAPTRQSSIAGPSLAWGSQATFDLPNSWGQAIVDGTSGGIGIYESDGSPYMILDGRSTFSPSGVLTIAYQRSN